MNPSSSDEKSEVAMIVKDHINDHSNLFFKTVQVLMDFTNKLDHCAKNLFKSVSSYKTTFKLYTEF